MNRAYLISEKTLKETVLNDNIDSSYIEPAIELAQVSLEQVIGTDLMNKLMTLVNEHSMNEPENKNYKILLNDYITDYLKWQVLSEITLLIAYKNRNAGVVQTNNEHQSNTQMGDAQFMKDYYENKANFYAIKTTNYLKSNNSMYPEYKSCKGEINSNEMGFNTHIYLD